MNTQELCVLMGITRAANKVQTAARECEGWEAIFDRWGQSLKPVEPRWLNAAENWCRSDYQGVISYFSEDYPAALKAIANPPWLLYYRGRKELLQGVSVAIVGSRKATHSGLQIADWFSERLVAAGVVVVSGLAMGIDAQAHKTAADKGKTIAVLGTGIDQYYPRRNKALQDFIAHQGLLISEFPPGQTARVDHFPRRNRIISGISQAVVVVEAARKSGSLSTAIHALNEGREVGAVPGSVLLPEHQGCHWLIQQGAKLINTPQDILDWFSVDDTEVAIEGDTECRDESLANNRLFASLSSEPRTIDDMVQLSGLEVAEVMEKVVLLELEGLVAAVPGGYIKVGRR
ncbi:DNA-processing protein DprA [Idiomarina sp. Sol25]|uniref:DNA-processing protein DprA n=2 Tax=Idiomarina TaxID=135575 RepID=UPI00294AAA03|nr:DNA-processing protein DprA [Idiomarina sp. Sol25]